MYNDPIPFIFVSFAAGILSLVLLALIKSYITAIEKLNHSEQVNYHLQEVAGQKPLKLMQDAQEKALMIIDEANKKAGEILDRTNSYEDATKTDLKEKLTTIEKEQQDSFQKASLDIQQTYKTALDQIKQEHINILNNIIKGIETDVLLEFKDFKQTLEKETIDSEKTIEQKIDKHYEEIEKEVDLYKKTSMQKVDQNIYKILYRVSEIILGKGITLEQQQQLVIDSLDEAKKEHVI